MLCKRNYVVLWLQQHSWAKYVQISQTKNSETNISFWLREKKKSVTLFKTLINKSKYLYMEIIYRRYRISDHQQYRLEKKSCEEKMSRWRKFLAAFQNNDLRISQKKKPIAFHISSQ